jgi:tRNA-dihydrouridine synthase B
MASSRAIFHNDEKTKKLLDVEGEKRPIAVQIFGNDPKIMAFAANEVSGIADIIDINMGCPAPKVVKNGDGSKLLLNPELIEEIVQEVVKAVEKPVTVKMRKGWDKSNINAVEVAKIIEQAGASAITIHGRTREEYYSGRADLDIIKQVKENVNIPVIGNGDIKSIEDANKMFDYCNVDGIMIGRATIGNPWIINDIIKGEKREISNEEKLKVLKQHIELAVAEKGEYIAVREMRKHICWYIKNLKESSKIREKINRIEDVNELEACLEEYFKSL